MKRFITMLGFVLLLAPTAPASEQSLLARVTVYWASGGGGSDRYTRQHKCATGTRLRSGHCAVDPRKIPYGSQVVFPDRTSLVAVDTGSAVISRKAARRGGRTVYEKSAVVVDRFFETKRQALSWAQQNPSFMTVRVIPPGYRPQPQPTQPSQPSQRIGNSTLLANNRSRFDKGPLSLLKPGYKVP
jgi:3D (Asp-Asp-Asp) domain-containing protein